MTESAASRGVRTVAFSCPYIKQQESLNTVEEESICQGRASALPFPTSRLQFTIIPVNRISETLHFETDHHAGRYSMPEEELIIDELERTTSSFGNGIARIL
jgi:hypothetical protein